MNQLTRGYPGTLHVPTYFKGHPCTLHERILYFDGREHWLGEERECKAAGQAGFLVLVGITNILIDAIAKLNK